MFIAHMHDTGASAPTIKHDLSGLRHHFIINRVPTDAFGDSLLALVKKAIQRTHKPSLKRRPITLTDLFYQRLSASTPSSLGGSDFCVFRTF